MITTKTMTSMMTSLTTSNSEVNTMGCNLKDLVRPQSIDLNDLAGERVAVDVFLSAYQFITAMTSEDGRPLSRDGKPVAHIMGFLDRATALLAAGIAPVFVFDGRPHILKQDTLNERRDRKKNAQIRWKVAIEEGDMKAAKKIGPQIAEYTREMVQETKDLFDTLGVAWIEAPMEAEGAAAVRARRGELHAVATQDWDALLYGSPIMIRNLMSHGTRKFGRTLTAEKIVLSDVLEEHEITQEQLVDLGIMIGTDFHPGFRGIGPKTGLKLIKAHGTLESVAEVKGHIVPENIDDIRELFHNHPIHTDVNLPETGRAVEEQIRRFVQKERGFSENRTERALERLASVGRLRSESKPTLFDF